MKYISGVWMVTDIKKMKASLSARVEPYRNFEEPAGQKQVDKKVIIVLLRKDPTFEMRCTRADTRCHS